MDVELPGTEEAARTNFALPMGTDLTEEQAGDVVQHVSREIRANSSH